MINKPLGMPAGTVRAIITIVAVLAAIIFSGIILYSKIVYGASASMPEFVLPLVGTVVGYYFGVRSADQPTTTETPANKKDDQPAIKYNPPVPSDEEPTEVKAG